MSNLFDQNQKNFSPLAHRLRPQKLENYLGQEKLTGPDGVLTRALAQDKIFSMIFCGPPGCGKTTLAHLLATQLNTNFIAASAISSGIKEIREIMDKAREQQSLYSKRTILFLDEIHRFNKSQQDVLLGAVEEGTITLIGATTENPSFAINQALLSRLKVFRLEPLSAEHLNHLIEQALSQDSELKEKKLSLTPEARTFLIDSSEGDARKLLTSLEAAVMMNNEGHEISKEDLEAALNHLFYDRSGEEHYNVISAFIKSMRGSDPDAALYYMARRLEAGEDPLFIIRRMVIFASEDIGNADPRAIMIANACRESFEFNGMPEGWIPMAQCVTYLASAPKSNAPYAAYKKVKADVMEFGTLPVPDHLRNAPTQLTKEWGYGKGYEYAHDQQGQRTSHAHLPEKLVGGKYYEPKGIGFEKNILEWLRNRK